LCWARRFGQVGAGTLIPAYGVRVTAVVQGTVYGKGQMLHATPAPSQQEIKVRRYRRLSSLVAHGENPACSN
jgi:hypothetical protein